jgi:HAD superfamily hydrolase (TIGR01490 family)
MATISSEDNIRKKSYIVFFDLDDTLTGVNSGRALAQQAYKKGLMSRSDLVKAIWFSLLYRFNLMNTHKIIGKMVGWVEGLPEKTIPELSSEITTQILLPSIRKEVLQEINFHRENKAGVVILSSALRPVCQEIAEYLRLDDVLCSDLEVVNGHYTGRPVGHMCFGGEKAKRLTEYCIKNGANAEEAWYYGDSFTDLPALSTAGHPVCINPDKKLKKTALKKKWLIYQWH